MFTKKMNFSKLNIFTKKTEYARSIGFFKKQTSFTSSIRALILFGTFSS